MRNYISMYITVPLLLFAMAVIGFTLVSAQAPFKSVELGIAEASPRGLSGGLAMPASGASVELSYRQTGESTWQTASVGILPDDDPVDLQWDSLDGLGSGSQTARMNDCTFTAGYNAPGGTLAIDGTSLGEAVSRLLSETGGSSVYTVNCIDNHEESGHSGTPYSDSDTVELFLETECNDNADNDGDSEIDEDDPGCHTDGDPDDGDDTYDPRDDDEDDSSPTMTLIACDSDGSCVGSGETLIIDETDDVTVTWTSNNTDFCDSVGTFTMPSGDTTSGSDVNVPEPDLDETLTYVVACGNDGVPQIARAVSARQPAIRLIPYPNPPIVPSGGMPPSDPATVEPIIDGYLPSLCTLSGPEGTQTIQSMMGSGGDSLGSSYSGGSFTDGKYEVTLYSQGETVYVLECTPDTDGDGLGDGDPVSDTVIFRILPVIQET